MKTNIECIVVAAVGTALVLATGLVQAQSAGDWLLRGGATQITPRVDSGDLTPPSPAGTKVDIKADTELTGGLTYMLTDNIAIDVPIGLPYKHDIVGAGAITGVGKLGDVHSLPITALAQYRFLQAQSKFRPYVGAGLTYVKFYKAKSTATLSALTGGTPGNPTTLSVDSKLAPTLQLGASVALNERWFLDASYLKTFLKTRATLSTGQTIDTRLNPDTISLSVGYRF